ncbi:MAG: response regulator transcription factor [Nitriliruptorales bacterium]|nr:response regulator transcription factor [Nitriliruptorales bacterium]
MRILLADDHRIVREGLRWMLSGEPDIEIVGEANDGEELLEQLDGYDGPVDIVLLDVRMPGLGGLDVLKRLGGTEPSPGKPAVVILSMHSEPAVVRRAVQLGAAGYLLKNTTRDQLLAALRSVAAGKCFVQTDITGPLLDHVAGRDRLEELPKLTERELEVLALVAAGQANKQIAAELGLSEATIKTHLKAIFVRLHAANRAEAAAKALQLGLIGNP